MWNDAFNTELRKLTTTRDYTALWRIVLHFFDLCIDWLIKHYLLLWVLYQSSEVIVWDR